MTTPEQAQQERFALRRQWRAERAEIEGGHPAFTTDKGTGLYLRRNATVWLGHLGAGKLSVAQGLGTDRARAGRVLADVCELTGAELQWLRQVASGEVHEADLQPTEAQEILEIHADSTADLEAWVARRDQRKTVAFNGKGEKVAYAKSTDHRHIMAGQRNFWWRSHPKTYFATQRR